MDIAQPFWALVSVLAHSEDFFSLYLTKIFVDATCIH